MQLDVLGKLHTCLLPLRTLCTPVHQPACRPAVQCSARLPLFHKLCPLCPVNLCPLHPAESPSWLVLQRHLHHSAC